MIQLIYIIFSSFASLLVAPLFAGYSKLTGKKKRGLAHHFGNVESKDSAEGKYQKTLWLHALSVGEVNAAEPVLRQVHKQSPYIRIVVSVTTDSGFDTAQKRLDFADQIIFHPLDCWPFVKRAVNRIQPDIFILTDTGFWPGLLFALRQRGTPAILFNGRISKQSLRRYRLIAPLVAKLLNIFQVICMQSDKGAKAVKSLGASPEKVQVLGDTKYDAQETVDDNERALLKQKLNIAPGQFVWVAGSTHEGEEEIILEAFHKLLRAHDSLILILAPRRLERVPAVVKLLQKGNFSFVKRSELNGPERQGDSVILLDTMGELAKMYAVADAAFVGRSLIAPGGGHSLIEPAAQGVPVLHGPYIGNNRHTALELEKPGLAFTVNNADQIQETLHDILADESRRQTLAQTAIEFVEEKKGASNQLAEIIFKTLQV